MFCYQCEQTERTPAAERPGLQARLRLRLRTPAVVDAAAETARDGGVDDENVILERYLPTGA